MCALRPSWRGAALKRLVARLVGAIRGRHGTSQAAKVTHGKMNSTFLRIDGLSGTQREPGTSHKSRDSRNARRFTMEGLL